MPAAVTKLYRQVSYLFLPVLQMKSSVRASAGWVFSDSFLVHKWKLLTVSSKGRKDQELWMVSL